MLANQETTIVQLGNEEILWKRFQDAVVVICFFRPPPPTSFLNPVNHNINVEAFDGRARQRGRRYGYYHWPPELAIKGSYQYFYARDKVFSLRSLMVPETARLVPVDYTKSAKETFTSLCISHLAEHEDIQFLHLCNADTNPSWAADPETTRFTYSHTCNASGKSAASAYILESGVLDVAGVTCDEIRSDPVHVPLSTVSQSYADYSRDIVSTFQKLAMGDLIHDDRCLDQLVLMLTYGSVRYYDLDKLLPLTDWLLSSLEEWRQGLRQFMSCSLDKDKATEDHCAEISCLRNVNIEMRIETGCSVTQGGSHVRVPPGSRSGDKIAVLLGLSTAVVLRP